MLQRYSVAALQLWIIKGEDGEETGRRRWRRWPWRRGRRRRCNSSDTGNNAGTAVHFIPFHFAHSLFAHCSHSIKQYWTNRMRNHQRRSHCGSFIGRRWSHPFRSVSKEGNQSDEWKKMSRLLHHLCLPADVNCIFKLTFPAQMRKEIRSLQPPVIQSTCHFFSSISLYSYRIHFSSFHQLIPSKSRRKYFRLIQVSLHFPISFQRGRAGQGREGPNELNLNWLKMAIFSQNWLIKQSVIHSFKQTGDFCLFCNPTLADFCPFSQQLSNKHNWI